MINPYDNLNFSTQVKSFSHMHMDWKDYFMIAVNNGYQHFCPSNYNPSAPFYPLEDVGTFKDAMLEYGVEGVIGSPNSEKVKSICEGFGNGQLHFCALGSFCEGYGYAEGDYYAPWKTIFDDILSNLQYPDGGGITLNHPDFGGAKIRCEMLDYDDRVLGIEIFNNCEEHAREGYNEPYYKGWYKDIYLPLWDEILRTGRRCWGFAVTDWQTPEYLPHYGSNILIVPELTEYNCLKAYRDGNFYGIVKDTGIRFSNISFDQQNNQVSVGVNKDAHISIYTNDGLVASASGQTASYTVKSSDIYVRVEAVDASDEDGHILSNPIMFKSKEEVGEPDDVSGDSKRKRMLLLFSHTD